MTYALCLAGGALVGGLLVWLWAAGRSSAARSSAAELRAQLQKAQEDFRELRVDLQQESRGRVEAETKLTEARRYIEEQKALLEESKKALSDTFKALSKDALTSNNEAFLTLAKKALEATVVEAKGDIEKRRQAIDELVKPLREALKTYEEHVKALEVSREGAYKGLRAQVEGLSTLQEQLRDRTGNLVTALRRPEVRGKWGEMTLQRVAKLAGMSEHCDFTEQVSVESEEGRLRPDMVVHMPAGRQIVVDAKVPLDAYLNAVSAGTDEERATQLQRHARQMRNHMDALAGKGYWSQFERAPDIVVMFIPGESFFSAAVDCDRTLIEDGMRKRVVLATPTTFIALLRSVAYGWRQEEISQNAQNICDLGRDLYERLRTLAEHFEDMGKGLLRANEAYDAAIGSMKARVFTAARRFREMGAAAGKEIPVLEPLERTPRKLTMPEADTPESEE